MAIGLWIAWAWLAGCTENEIECRADTEAFSDADGDGYGDGSLGLVCALEAGQADRGLDCDDGDAEVNPEARERCNGLDDNCNGEIDDGRQTTQYYEDGDGDGVGALFPSVLACEPPGEDWVESSDDCDDDDPAVHPGGGEKCGGGDEDCDGYVDDSDDDVDATTYLTWYRDADRDGAGDRNTERQACVQPDGWVSNTNDCDDQDPLFTYAFFYADADRDGYGDPTTSVPGCQVRAGQVDNGDDCDDNDATVHEVADWLVDADGDGYGSGLPVVTQCQPPGNGLVSSVEGVDCNETNTAIHPGARDACEDGIDQDCNGSDPRCGPIGSYNVYDGERWTNDPPVYTCLEACALLFGGVANDYHCSTDARNMNMQAYLSGYADATYCTRGAAEDWSVEPVNNPGYNCGAFGCAYSAYVSDNCFNSVNYCWLR